MQSDKLNVHLHLLAAEHGLDVLDGDARAVLDIKATAGDAFNYHSSLHDKVEMQVTPAAAGARIDLGFGTGTKKGGRWSANLGHRLNAAQHRKPIGGPSATDGKPRSVSGKSKAAKKKRKKIEKRKRQLKDASYTEPTVQAGKTGEPTLGS